MGLSEQEEPCEGMGGCPGLGETRARWGPSVKPLDITAGTGGDSPPVVTRCSQREAGKLPLTECVEHLAKAHVTQPASLQVEWA